MNLIEIKQRIDELYVQLEQCTDPCTFTLNKEAVKYQEEIDALRGQCTHDFTDGICKYCYTNEK